MIGFTENITNTYYDAFVGIGEYYSTIQEALADGKYRIKLVSDVTETVAWGVHTNNIFIEADELMTINLSVLNTLTSSTLTAKNINFSVSGTDAIFDTSTFNLYNCTITGSAEDNNFLNASSYIYANTLTIDTGAGTLKIRVLKSVDTLYYVGSGTISDILISTGHINNMIVSGTVTSGYSAPILTADSSRITKITNNVTSGVPVFKMTNSVIDSTEGEIKIWNHVDGSIYNNCEMSQFAWNPNIKDFSLINCTINDFYENPTHNKLLVKPKVFRNNIINNALDIAVDDIVISDCEFDALTISSDNVSIEKCTANSITINATADKTIVVGCRTQTEIVDNGTNTILVANRLI